LATSLVVVAGSLSCGDAGGGGASEGPAARTASTIPVRSGRFERWPEATSRLVVSVDGDRTSVALGDARSKGVAAFWSIASTRGEGSGFFYSDAIRGGAETRVAHAAAVRRVKDIRDATALDWSRPVVGPVEVGGVVVIHHVPSDRYLAIALEAIVPTDPRTAGAGPYAYADVTWYLTEPGSADFSSAP
jgi:hypothetical protein